MSKFVYRPGACLSVPQMTYIDSVSVLYNLHAKNLEWKMEKLMWNKKNTAYTGSYAGAIIHSGSREFIPNNGDKTRKYKPTLLIIR